MTGFITLKEENKRAKVFIGIPSFRSQMHVQLSGRIHEWGCKYDIQVAYARGATPLHAARNLLVELFLKTDCEYLFFIDDDVVPPSDALDELIEADKDIIMPLTLMIKPITEEAAVPVPQSMRNHDPTKEGYKPCWGTGIEEVDTIGGAAFFVKRKVFEEKPYKFRFEYYPNGRRKKGADVAFSEDMRARGYKLYAHYDLPCQHIRQVDLLRIYKALSLLAKEKKENGD
jgi:hypothetical protein